MNSSVDLNFLFHFVLVLTLVQLRYEIAHGARFPNCFQRELTDRKVRGSNPTSASRLPLSRLGQPGSIQARWSGS
ncbi:hypothetical protein CSKR_114505 [Clonorchis sinensis]|uniref:Uncharacterized protein n=1 Tax=Clonorchis sinensis TaxID=79923 RepID=A0A419Q9Y1_CLOSI|nr:hypothetical protein CSKR_114505 [Clonorchis sinensis]